MALSWKIVGVASAVAFASWGAPTALDQTTALDQIGPSAAHEKGEFMSAHRTPGGGSKAKAQGAEARGATSSCDAGSIYGVYALHGTGFVRSGPFAFAGHFAFDGEGQVAGRLTEVSDQRVDHVAFTGTYSVDSDCRGEGEIIAQHEGFVDRHTFEFYGAASGQRFFWVLTGTSFEEPPIGDAVEALVVTLSGVGERL